MSEYNNGNNPLHSSDTTNPEARYTQPQPPQVWQSWHEANGSQPAPTPVSPAAAPQTAQPSSGSSTQTGRPEVKMWTFSGHAAAPHGPCAA